jgi:aspartyl-tRNA(Asn)/glutamyl-tRNA(Gln) amidotransferase subunit A
VPAAWNGLVGLKTTHGRLPLDGVVPLVENFDTVGPITRTVEDAALLLAALEGRKPPDLEGATLRGVRLLVLDSVALDDCRPEPLAAFENAVARLKEAGARIEHVVAPEVDEALALSLPLFTAEAYAIWAERIEAQPDMMFAPIRDRFRAGAKVMAGEYVNAWRSLRNLRIVWNDRLAGCDAVLMPTTAILPPLSERLQADATYFAAENLLALRNTRIVNLMGGAAITLPSGEPMCGITLTGGPGSDGRLLRLASAAEVALR